MRTGTLPRVCKACKLYFAITNASAVGSWRAATRSPASHCSSIMSTERSEGNPGRGRRHASQRARAQMLEPKYVETAPLQETKHAFGGSHCAGAIEKRKLSYFASAGTTEVALWKRGNYRISRALALSKSGNYSILRAFAFWQNCRYRIF